MADPFCYVAHKNGYWAGIISPAIGKHELTKFFHEFGSGGFTITPFATREEYSRFLDTVKGWSKSPEWQAKHGVAA